MEWNGPNEERITRKRSVIKQNCNKKVKKELLTIGRNINKLYKREDNNNNENRGKERWPITE